MGWQAYHLTYRAVTPIALGAYRFGFIQRTRYYAPGWTLWGAITAQLTRAILPRAGGDDYETIGHFVKTNLPTSYAYILVDDEPAWPQYREGQFYYGPLSAAEFEARFVTSFGQTAIAPATFTAHTGTLHETELLSPRDQVGGEPVLWRFTLYVRQPWRNLPERLEGLEVQKVLDALEHLTLGGDRGYGFGRLVRGEIQGREDLGEGEWPRPLDWNPQERVLRAHVELKDLAGEEVRGRAEPVVRRLWQNDPGEGTWGPGQRRERHLLYAPGSRVERANWQPLVGPLGIWMTEGDHAPT